MPGARPATSVAARAGSVAVGGDVVGSIIVNGDGNTIRLVVGPEHGDLLEVLARSAAPVVRARPTPVLARPQPFADHLDREGETSAVLAAAESASPVNVYAPSGAGKTYLLVHAANQRAAERAADGVVFIDATGAGHDDLLQLLFDELYESQPPSKTLAAEITRSLRQRQATVLVDGFELHPDEAQRFFLAAGGSRFVVASRDRASWNGTAVRLGGLDSASAVALMEREIGRPLGDNELPAARAVHQALAGNPLHILRAAAAVVDEGLTFDELARRLAAFPAPEASLGPLAQARSKEERAVLAALSVLGPEGAGTALIAAAAGVGDVSRVLEGLRRRRLIVPAPDGRYLLAGQDEGEGIAGVDLGAATERAASALLLRSVPAAGAGTLLAVLRSARRHGRHGAVVGLGRAVSGALALSRMWGAWQEVLDAVLVAARQMNDQPGEAWALHQLGTRLVSIGLVDEGVTLLQDAVEIRRALGDAEGVAATRQNLEVARRITSGPPAKPWAAIVAAVAVLAVGLALWAILRPDPNPPRPTLSVATAGGGGGGLTSSPAGIDCIGSCAARFAKGEKVTLTATAADGSVFSRWEAPGCTGDGPCTVTMDGDTSATAHFDAAVRTRTLTVAKGGQGAGAILSSPSGISCGSTCRASFAAGTEVTLTATAGAGSRFVRWEVPGCSGTGTCILRLDADVSAIARFEAVAVSRTLTVLSNGKGAGTVQSSPSGISCGGTCTASFADGTQVTLTATAGPGSAFVRWNVAGCSGTEPCTIVMDADRSATATFTRVWGVVVRLAGRGSGSVTSRPPGIACTSTGGSCTDAFAEDSVVVLTATPGAGSYLAGWAGGGCSGRELTCRVVIRPQSPLGGPPTVTATFLSIVE